MYSSLFDKRIRFQYITELKSNEKNKRTQKIIRTSVAPRRDRQENPPRGLSETSPVVYAGRTAARGRSRKHAGGTEKRNDRRTE